MKRREMLKGLGLSVSALALTPTLVSLLQSCTSEKQLTWVPEFFTRNQATVVNLIADVILPKTKDLPGAKELNVPKFIDGFVKTTLTPDEQQLFKKGLDNISSLSLKKANITNVNSLSNNNIEAVLKDVLNKSKSEHIATIQTYNKFLETLETNKNALLDDAVLNYVFLDNIRSLIIFGYKSNEYIGKEVLAYYPVPGKQQGCIDLQDATGGKAYSLDWY